MGKKIGIFTASTPIGALFPERLERAISFLEKKDFSIVRGDLITKSNGSYRSGDIQERINEIIGLIDNNVDILLSAIGGHNSSSLLPQLPYDLIDQKEIIVCGFSDTTAILNAIVKNCPHARAIYSPALVPNFGSSKISAQISYNHLSKFIDSKQIKLEPLEFFYKFKVRWEKLEKKTKSNCAHFRGKCKSEWGTFNVVNENKLIKGKLFGGNGSTLSHILGTEYVIPFPKNGILFIEDAEKELAEVERIFSSFLLHGILKDAQAIILGKHDDYKGEKKQPWEILKEILDFNKLKTPVIYDVDVSHSQPMLALELNKNTTINFKEKSIFQDLK